MTHEDDGRDVEKYVVEGQVWSDFCDALTHSDENFSIALQTGLVQGLAVTGHDVGFVIDRFEHEIKRGDDAVKACARLCIEEGEMISRDDIDGR